MSILWWLWDLFSGDTATIDRPITVRGHIDTAITVTGRIDTAISCRGSIDTAVSIVGGDIMSAERHISFHQGERISITVTDINVAGQTVVATIRDGETDAILAQSTATVSGGVPTAVFTRSETLAIPCGASQGLRRMRHYWDMSRTTSAGEAVLAYGEAICRASPTLQS